MGSESIPLGGYVKITGMNPNEKMQHQVRARAYYNQKVWKRVVVILAGPAVNLVIAFAIFFAVGLSQGETVAVRHHGQPVFSHHVQSLVPPASQYLKPGDRDRRRGRAARPDRPADHR